jgi:hypothetical protein
MSTDCQLTVHKVAKALNMKRETVILTLTKDFNMKACGRIVLNILSSEQKMRKISSDLSARLLKQHDLLGKNG